MSIFTPTSSNHAAPSFRVPTSGLARLIALVTGEWHAMGAARTLRTLATSACRAPRSATRCGSGGTDAGQNQSRS